MTETDRPMMPGRNGGMLRKGGPGRPRGCLTLTTHLRHLLDEVHDGSGKTKGRLLAEALLLHAMKGNGQAIREILGRIDGPLMQHVTLTGSRHEQYNFENFRDDELRELELYMARAIVASGGDDGDLPAEAE